MTVRELIQKLQQTDPEFDVFVVDGTGEAGEIESVTVARTIRSVHLDIYFGGDEWDDEEEDAEEYDEDEELL